MTMLSTAAHERGDAPPTDADAASAYFVHGLGCCESADIGAGTRIWAFAHVLAGAVVGSGCNVGDHAYIEGGAVVGDRVTIKNQVMIFAGVTIDDDVFIGPGATFTNDLRPRAHLRRTGSQLLPTRVRRGATLGARVTVVCGTTVGAHAFAAAGAVIHRDVADHALVVGNPARQVGWVCVCAERLDPDLGCRCGRRYEAGPSGLREL